MYQLMFYPCFRRCLFILLSLFASVSVGPIHAAHADDWWQHSMQVEYIYNSAGEIIRVLYRNPATGAIVAGAAIPSSTTISPAIPVTVLAAEAAVLGGEIYAIGYYHGEQNDADEAFVEMASQEELDEYYDTTSNIYVDTYLGCLQAGCDAVSAGIETTITSIDTTIDWLHGY